MSSNNTNLHSAKTAKNDEFYTQYSDIQAEINAYVSYNPDVFKGKTILCPCDDPEWSNFTKFFVNNFEYLGLKKLISTSYAKSAMNKQPTFFELASESYDKEKHENHGRVFILEKDEDNSGTIDENDIKFSYLEGDGDFRSEEVKKLRDEADVIVTNGPFSLYRQLLAWIMEGDKEFIIMGNMNAITYKEVFPLLKENKIWLGYTSPKTFLVPVNTNSSETRGNISTLENGTAIAKFGNIYWYTNLDHGKRHEKLQLMTMEQNLMYNKKLRKKLLKEYGKLEYPKYDNYDAIEVPFTECIPSDYKPCWFTCKQAESCPWAQAEGLDNSKQALCEEPCNGAMAAPITCLDRTSSEQFEILDANNIRSNDNVPIKSHGLIKDKEAVITIYEKDEKELDMTAEESHAKTTNNKQQTTNNKQQTTNNKQQTTNNKQQTTNNKQQTTDQLRKNCHPSQESVTESSEYQSLSSIRQMPINSKSLESPTVQDGSETSRVSLLLKEEKFTTEYSSNSKCNGILGLPITFLSKYCKKQFDIVGLDRYIANNPNYGHRFTINNKELYARVLIRYKQETK